jgi:hypothetical protein
MNTAKAKETTVTSNTIALYNNTIAEKKQEREVLMRELEKLNTLLSERTQSHDDAVNALKKGDERRTEKAMKLNKERTFSAIANTLTLQILNINTAKKFKDDLNPTHEYKDSSNKRSMQRKKAYEIKKTIDNLSKDIKAMENNIKGKEDFINKTQSAVDQLTTILAPYSELGTII